MGRALFGVAIDNEVAAAAAAATTARATAMLYVADAAVNNCDKKACEFLTNILCIDLAEYPGIFFGPNSATYIAMANAKDRGSTPIPIRMAHVLATAVLVLWLPKSKTAKASTAAQRWATTVGEKFVKQT